MVLAKDSTQQFLRKPIPGKCVEIIDKKKVNLNALFYAVCTLVGITIDPLAETRNQDG